MQTTISRRHVLLGAVGALTAANCSSRRTIVTPSQVSVTKAPEYTQAIYETVRGIFRDHALAIKGKRVVVKPNMVEFDADTSINTHPMLVHAVYEAVKAEGAADVKIAEGPGHRRGTLDLADAAGYFQTVPEFEKSFVDLNLDSVSRVVLPRPVSKLKELYLPQTVLGADLLISVPKMKTHHWVGATLSMKNLFGLVPGAVYGWPKNVLHWAGIAECIMDINSLFPNTFAIVDGIIGMEGNGPIQGRPKRAGVLVAGRHFPSVDATCCRIMRIDPSKIPYLPPTVRDEANIRQIRESILTTRTAFELIPEFRSMRG